MITELLYDLIQVCLLALAAVLSAGSLSTQPVHMPVFATLISCIFSVLFLHLKTRGRLLLSGLLLGITVGWMLSSGLDPLSFLSANRLTLCIFPGCILAALFVKGMKQLPHLRILPVTAGILLLAYCLISKRSLSANAFILTLLFLLISAVEWIQIRWNKEGDCARIPHVVHTFPFLILLTAVLYCMPVPEQPFDWKPFRDFFSRMHSAYERFAEEMNLKDSWMEEEGLVGFSDDSRFFSSIHSMRYEVFEVSSPVPFRSIVYLSGKTFDTFDGRHWKKLDASGETDRLYDVLETAGAVLRYDPANLQDYLRSASLRVNCRGISSDHVFLPAKSIPFVQNRKTIQKGGDLLFESSRPGTYTVTFFRMNTAYDSFQELLRQDYRQESGINEEALQLVGNLFPKEDLSGYTTQGLLKYRSAIKEQYGQPPHLSPGLKTTLEELLDGADSDYDRLIRLEQFFRSMNYTSHPGELPEEIDSPAGFMDYLVFDSKQGYCTHFATAFVLLARECGIPARYVQGYRFVTSPEGTTSVLSSCAHAWAEAYLEGIGWITFDPTPGSGSSDGWKTAAQTAEAVSNSSAGPEREDANAESHDIPSASHSIAADHLDPGRRILSPVLLTLCILVFILAVDLLVRWFRYCRKQEREQLQFLFRRCLWMLKRMKLVPGTGETLREFKARASLSVPAETLSFIDMYEEICYSERPATPADTEQIRQACMVLFRLWIRKRFGKQAFRMPKKTPHE